MNGKRHFNEIKINKYAYISYFETCVIIFLQNHHALQYTSPNASLVFEIRPLKNWCFVFETISSLQVFTSSTALPSVLLHSHQQTDHHKRLAFVCEFQLDELFPRLRIQ